MIKTKMKTFVKKPHHSLFSLRKSTMVSTKIFNFKDALCLFLSQVGKLARFAILYITQYHTQMSRYHVHGLWPTLRLNKEKVKSNLRCNVSVSIKCVRKNWPPSKIKTFFDWKGSNHSTCAPLLKYPRLEKNSHVPLIVSIFIYILIHFTYPQPMNIFAKTTSWLIHK